MSCSNWGQEFSLIAESLKLETFSEVRLGIDAFRSETEDNFPVVVVSVKLGSKGVQLKLLVVDDLPITISTPGIVAVRIVVVKWLRLLRLWG